MAKYDTEFPSLSVEGDSELDTLMLPALTLEIKTLGGKPSPETVTTVPGTPEAGESVMVAPGTEWMATPPWSKPKTPALTMLSDEISAVSGTVIFAMNAPTKLAETTVKGKPEYDIGTWLLALVSGFAAGKFWPMTVTTVFILLDAGSKVIMGVLMVIWVVSPKPWSSKTLMEIGPPATVSAVMGMVMEAVQLPSASKSMG